LELLQGKSVKKVITSCPHCFNTLKNEYPALGGEFETIHHSQLINDLLKKNQIKVKPNSFDALTYHDSCYIGRYNGIYDEPREILEKVAGAQVIELKRSRDKGFCCGAGGGRMWLEEQTGSRINVNRAEEILDSQAKTVGVGCPFCMTMISDGLKSKDRSDIQVKDLAEIVSEALDDKPSSV
jgi:Fe-S oxidoreductase